MTDETRTAVAGEAPAETEQEQRPTRPLAWEYEDETTLAACSHALSDEDVPFRYRIACDEEEHEYMPGGDEELAPAWAEGEWPGPFATLDEAKQACQEIEDVYQREHGVEPEEAAADDADSDPDPEETIEVNARLYRAMKARLSDLEHIDGDIYELGERIRDAKAEWHEAKEVASQHKKRVETLQNELERLILDRENLPLFDSASEEPQAAPAASDDAKAEAPADPDAWREEAVGELASEGLGDARLSPSIVEALTEQEPSIQTLGDLSQAMDGEGWWRRLKGIGEKKAEAIGNAMQAWYSRNPEKWKVEEEADGSDGDKWADDPEARPLHGFITTSVANAIAAGAPDLVGDITVGDYMAIVEQFGEVETLRTLNNGEPQQLQAEIQQAHDAIRRWAKFHGIWPLADDESTDDDAPDEQQAEQD